MFNELNIANDISYSITISRDNEECVTFFQKTPCQVRTNEPIATRYKNPLH